MDSSAGATALDAKSYLKTTLYWSRAARRLATNMPDAEPYAQRAEMAYAQARRALATDDAAAAERASIVARESYYAARGTGAVLIAPVFSIELDNTDAHTQTVAAHLKQQTLRRVALAKQRQAENYKFMSEFHARRRAERHALRLPSKKTTALSAQETEEKQPKPLQCKPVKMVVRKARRDNRPRLTEQEKTERRAARRAENAEWRDRYMADRAAVQAAKKAAYKASVAERRARVEAVMAKRVRRARRAEKKERRRHAKDCRRRAERAERRAERHADRSADDTSPPAKRQRTLE